MAEVASAFLSILPSAKGFGKSLESQASGEVKSTGSRLGGALGTAMKVGLLAGGVAVAAFGKSVISAASDAQQSIGATETVFGKFANTVISTSDQAAQKYGLSANVYRENANLIGSLFKNQGVATEDLAGKTQEMIGVGADLAATFGGTTTDAVETLGAAFKGEYDSIERYGISLKESTVSALLAKRGQDKLTGSQLAAAKQAAVTDLIMQQSKDSLGAFGKESDTLAGQQQRLGASFDNIKATIGTALLPVLTQFAGFVNSSVLPAVTGFIAQMKSGEGAGGRFASAFQTVAAILTTVVGFIVSNKEAVGAFAGVILTVAAAAKAWTIAQLALNIALTANPIGLVVVAVAALVAGLVIAYKRSETFRTIVNAAFSAVKTVVGAAVRFVGDLIGKVWPTIAKVTAVAFGLIKTYITTYITVAKTVVGVAIAAIRGYFNLIGAIVSKVRQWFGEIVSAVREKLSDAAGAVRDFPGRVTSALGNLGSVLYDAGAELIQGLINGITSKIGAIKDKMSEVAGAVKGFLPGSPVKEGPLTSWNNGGAGKRLMESLAGGIEAGGPRVFAATAKVAGGIAVGADFNHAQSFAGVSRGGANSDVLAELRALRAAVSVQGREFGREINGAATSGHRGRVA